MPPPCGAPPARGGYRRHRCKPAPVLHRQQRSVGPTAGLPAEQQRWLGSPAGRKYLGQAKVALRLVWGSLHDRLIQPPCAGVLPQLRQNAGLDITQRGRLWVFGRGSIKRLDGRCQLTLAKLFLGLVQIGSLGETGGAPVRWLRGGVGSNARPRRGGLEDLFDWRALEQPLPFRRLLLPSAKSFARAFHRSSVRSSDHL